MKKVFLIFCLALVVFCTTGCGGGSSSSTTTVNTATTASLTLKANLGTGTTFSNLRAATLSAGNFKFRIKPLVSGEPSGSWLEVIASVNSDGTLGGNVSLSDGYSEFLMELLNTNGATVLTAVQNIEASGNSTIEATSVSTARRIVFENWKTSNNPGVKTYNNFVLNLSAAQIASIDTAANTLAGNIASYVAYLSGETTTIVEPFLQEWADGNGYSQGASAMLGTLATLARTVATNNCDTTSANPASSGTNTGTGTSVDTTYTPGSVSSWPAISGSASTLEAAGKIAPHTFSAAESDSSYNAAGAVIITLNNDLTSVTGAGASYAGGVVTISAAGTYVLSGILNGHIFISGKLTDGVTLVLDGVNISGQTHAAIYSEKKSTPVSIILPAGKTNTLSDAATYTYAEDDEPGACLFVKGDLLIKGSGMLTVNVNSSENGIQSKGETNGLVITGGVFNVAARSNGIKGKMIAINGGTFNISVSGDGECFEVSETSIYIAAGTFNLASQGGDAIKAENDWEEDASITPDGDVYISGGNFVFNVYGDGIQATDELVVCGGTFNITTTNSAFEAKDESSKGIKSGTDTRSGSIIICGGDLTFTTTDHAVKSKGTVDITGAPAIRAYSSLGKGISGTGNVTIGKTGTPLIHITYAEEGLESKQILSIEGGSVRLNTWDDGINAGGEAGDGNTHMINLSGGYTYIEAKGDGIDSNGDISMSGGTLVVNANTSGNSAIDTDQGNFKFTGGTIVAAGPSEMACAPDSSTSTQPSLSINFSSIVSRGKLINIQKSDGTEIVTFFPAQDSSSLVYCSSTLVQGETYSIYIGGSHSGTNSDGVFAGGAYAPGTLYSTVTQTYTTTEVGTKISGPGFGIGGGDFGGEHMPPPGFSIR